jgi:nucleoside-diphosphate-sugar epimerase
MRTKVLVTGVAGFVASNLAKFLLARDFEVIGIDDLSAGTLANVDRGVDFHELDIRSAEIYPLFRGVDTVLHLAAKSSLTDCLSNPIEAATVNVVGTLNILEAAKKASVRKVIYADTSAEYEGIDVFPTPEDHIQPVGVYAASKHGGAAFCYSYERLYGMDITMTRYFNVYGPAQDWRRVIPPVMSAFILRMLKGQQPIIYGTGEKRRDFIYIDDVNELNLVLMTHPGARGRSFNVGTGTNYSVYEIYRAIEDLMQTGIKPDFRPDLPGEATMTLGDITRSKQLGWEPKVSLREGLIKTIAYLREMNGAKELASAG